MCAGKEWGRTNNTNSIKNSMNKSKSASSRREKVKEDEDLADMLGRKRSDSNNSKRNTWSEREM